MKPSGIKYLPLFPKGIAAKNIFHLSKRITLLLLTLLLLGVMGVYLAQLQFVLANNFLIDDAFIYLRFVRNFNQGLGLVWNPGEAPVEGFTSPLYLLLLIGAEKLGLSLTTLMPIWGLGASLLILVLSWQLGELLNPGHPLENLLALNLIALSPIFLYWSTTGMEMPFYTLLLMLSALSYLAYQRHKIPAWCVGGLFAITTLSRPESLALFALTLVFDSVTRFRQQKKLFHPDTLFMVMAFTLIYLPVFVWKWIYFGYPFPNTYYAKTDGISGVQVMGGLIYLIKNLMFYVFAGISVPLILALVKVNKVKWAQEFSSDRLYIALLVLGSWLAIVVNGGDHFIAGRFLMPTTPFLMVLVINVIFANFLEREIQLDVIRPAFMALPVLIALFYVQPWLFIAPGYIKTTLPPANPNKLEYFDYWDVGFIVMGKTLKTLATGDEAVAVVPIGAIGYYSNMRVIDMVGLVDPVIAHEPFDPKYVATWRPGHDKGNGLYVLSRCPEYIMLVELLTSQPLPGLNDDARQFKSVMEIWDSPDFHAHYAFYPVQTEGGWYHNLYRRVDTCP